MNECLLQEIEVKYKKRLDVNQSIRVTTSSDIFNFISSIDKEDYIENFYVIYLNRNNKIIAWKHLSKGSVTGVVVSIQLILKMGIEVLCSGLILCHNHPSGNLRPSQADIDLTERIKQAAKLFDITLLDHVIFDNDSHFSFADESIL